MASSLTPRSLRSSAVGFTRARSLSSNIRSPSTATGNTQCCSIQAERSLAPIPSEIRTSSNLTGIFRALSSLPEGCGGRGAASAHARFAAGVVVVRAAPVLDEVAQLLVRSLRQHDAQLHVQIGRAHV